MGTPQSRRPLRRKIAAVTITVALAVVAIAAILVRRYKSDRSRPTTPPAFTQDVYVWQRDWTPAVRDAVRDQSAHFRRIVILAAEVSWPNGNGKSAEVKYELAAGDSRGPAGTAVRIGPLPRGDQPSPEQEKLVVSTVIRAATAAKAAGLDVAEVQLDFDCAESKLAGYQEWVSAVRGKIAPVPVVITALPSWLHRPEFSELAHAADGFVIQVHSLHQPTGPDEPMSICDPAEARRAVQSASRIGVPFRIALPTYGYAVAFKPDRTFLGLAAEGPSPDWPAGTILREMRADPDAMATLVREWTADPPSNCTGIIWYRLPVPGDRMNWAPQTLAVVMTGRAPAADLIVDVVKPEPKLRDLFLVNRGDADAVFHGSVTATFDGPHDVTAEPLAGFSEVEEPPGRVTFQVVAADGVRIAPGGRLQVGWIRLDSDTEVRTDVKPFP